IILLLVVAFDVPCRIVGDDEDRLGAVTYRRVDLHRVDPEGAISRYSDDLSSGKGQSCRNRVGYADAKAAKGASIHVGASRQPDPSETQDVATIGDRDVVKIGDLCDCIKDPSWMHLPVRLESRLLAFAGLRSLALAPSHRVSPVLVQFGGTVAGSLHHRIERQLGSRQKLRQP